MAALIETVGVDMQCCPFDTQSNFQLMREPCWPPARSGSLSEVCDSPVSSMNAVEYACLL